MRLLGSFFVEMVLVLALLLLQIATAVPPGFRDEAVARLIDMSTITFLPGREGGAPVLFAAIKQGRVEAIFNPDETMQSSVTVLDISDRVCNNGERGLHQVIAHPDFLQDGKNYVYISYTYDKNGGCELDINKGPVNRLSRFTVSEDYVINEDSEEVFLESLPLENKIHNGGDMVFGNDGYLYLTMGDSGAKSNTALNLSNLFGTIIRLTDDGGIPPDNPFIGANSARCTEGGTEADMVCQETFAYGFRNPYRFAMNPNTDRSLTQLFVLDVGGKAWEEISEAGTMFPGANYGWSEREGPCARDTYDDCDAPEAEMTEPVYWYPHDFNGSGCVTGGAFVPNGLWPQEYDDSFLFTDFVWDFMYAIKQDVEPCPTCTPPLPAWSNVTFHDLAETENARPAQMLFGPYQDTLALYYTTREGRVNIRRIIFDGTNNSAPVAKIVANRTSGPVGVSLEFDGSESTDEDGDELTYLWDFGNGMTSEAPIRSHTFDAPGNYVVTLTVTDPEGFSSTAEITVDIGELPIPEIVSPEENTTFAVGDVLTLVGSAVDSDGNPLPDMALAWEVRQHHSTHYHPFLDPMLGNNITLDPAPSPEEFLAATNSYLEILLTATDSLGLEATISRVVMPRIVMLSFETIPDGQQILLDGYIVTTPVTVATWENHPLEVAAFDQNDLVFQDWSDGGDSMHTIIVGATEETYYGRFASNATSAPSFPDTEEAPEEAPVETTPTPQTVPTPSPPNANPTADPASSPSSASSGNHPPVWPILALFFLLASR